MTLQTVSAERTASAVIRSAPLYAQNVKMVAIVVVPAAVMVVAVANNVGNSSLFLSCRGVSFFKGEHSIVSLYENDTTTKPRLFFANMLDMMMPVLYLVEIIDDDVSAEPP